MITLKLIWTLIQKDLRIERKTKELFSSMIIYAAVVLVIFNFAFQSFTGNTESFSGGMLWIAFTFSATLGLSRLFSYEQENGVMQALALIPCDKGIIFIGKCLSMLIWLTLMEWLIVPLFCVLFDVPLWEQIPRLFIVLFLGSLGYVAAGTLLTTITLNTRMKENLLPLILFPITIPLIIASVEATQIIINQSLSASIINWISILIAFDVIILTGSYLLYGYIFEE
jgi:heme exporter protein B